MNTQITTQLEKNRSELLDLSTRNRLINTPIGSKLARLVQVFDEKTDETFRRLVIEKKTYTFLAGQASRAQKEGTSEFSFFDSDAEELTDLPLPDEDILDDVSGKAKRHIDTKLQTRLTPELLQRRLFDLYNESRMLLEEQGVNVLYLALGFIKWVDKDNGNAERFAPLVLIPVDLVRKSATEKFAIKWREEDLQDNLSLAEKFRREFGITLPEMGVDDVESFDIGFYLSQVAEAIKDMPGWEVQADNMCLGFFSFAKFLMYRDLKEENWPGKSILTHSLIRRLLLTRQESEVVMAQPSWAEGQQLDDKIPVERLDHVVDADSSQTIAIELVREGRDLVIQGPPGTGKSQTITNIIAAAVLDGKKVLFIAEKLAALEVVKRRLEKEGLGVLCLELHSNKARKAEVAADLKQTWELGKPTADGLHQLNEQLEKQRASLNGHASALHKPLMPLERSAFDFIGTIAKEGSPTGKEITVRFSSAESWTKQQEETYLSQLKELQIRLENAGDLASHPWRGAALTNYLGTERQLLRERLEEWKSNTQLLAQSAQIIGNKLGISVNEYNEEQLYRLSRLAYYAATHPNQILDTIDKPIWEEAYDTLLIAAKNKATFEAIAESLNDRVVPSVWKEDFTSLRQPILKHGNSFFKFLNRSYKKAVRTLEGGLTRELPKLAAEKIALLDNILEGQNAQQQVQQKGGLARLAFSSQWELDSNGVKLVEVAEWQKNAIVERLTAQERVAAYSADAILIGELRSELENLISQHKKLKIFFKENLKMDWSRYEAKLDAEDWTMDRWNIWQQAWLSNLDLLPAWSACQKQLTLCAEGPLKPLIELVKQGVITASGILVSYQRILAHQCLEHLFRNECTLVSFDGAIHASVVENFRQTDKKRLHWAKIKVLEAHYSRMPEKRPVGMIGTVLGEVNKQRSHKPIRKLLKEAGPVVQNLKPVFMMSPLSVAQYLEPGAIEFDLLVIDEASQVQPVDALGAVARCKQIVVVGDDKQLPPTKFFAKMTSNDSEKEEDGEDEGQVVAKDLESILSLCAARGIFNTMLRWHYRSQHESLIAVSNKRYYENKLFIVPSPWKANAGLGLVWRSVNGVYDRGNTKTNIKEAQEVAQAVLNHARNNPDMTLGVAAFSMPQQRAIQDEVEKLRRQYATEMEHFFAQYPHEPFFIKNLENVQGDERDVILLSVGYGKDVEGRMFQNFGPLNKNGGQRRLNVLISRARKRCEVFSSITEQDITISEGTREGVIGLKQFLQYTRTGIFDLAEQSGKPQGSPLEEAVKDAIERNFGWEVHAQVGIAGFFIDLAIPDPDKKGRYVLGIECDGVAYHSSPSARERDRLRQSVLESKGWFIHRLWGIDFFRSPEKELAKIKKSFDQALELLQEADALTLISPSEEKNVFHVERAQEERVSFVTDYIAAKQITVPNPDPYNLYASQVADIIHKILQIEAPIHKDELVTRMREQWGWSRAADRFRNHVSDGLQALVRTGKAKQEGSFILMPEMPVKVRRRNENAPPGTRKPAYIPPIEIEIAIQEVTRFAHALTREEAAKEVSVAMGFKSLSSDFRQIIGERIQQLVINGKLKEDEGKIASN